MPSRCWSVSPPDAEMSDAPEDIVIDVNLDVDIDMVTIPKFKKPQMDLYRVENLTDMAANLAVSDDLDILVDMYENHTADDEMHDLTDSYGKRNSPCPRFQD